MNKKPKFVKDPAKFLIETGLLFEINRTILHPLGLSLAFHIENDMHMNKKLVNSGKEEVRCSLLDFRNDEEGVVFTMEQMVGESRMIDKFNEKIWK